MKGWESMWRTQPTRLLLCFLFVVSVPCAAQEKKAAPEKADVAAVVKGNNEFAFDLYKQLAKQAKADENIIFSPYSISTALAMTYGGARGQTAEQMAKVLHFTLGQERLHPVFGGLIADLQKDDMTRPYQLTVANALWGQQGYAFLDDFLRVSTNQYRAGLQELDFRTQTEEARRTINRWVTKQTKDKIKDLLGPTDLSPETRLVLTNAIYFQAGWVTPFLKGETKDAVFEVKPGDVVSAPMMHTQEAPFKYFAADECQWLELPYNGGRLSMILILPQKGRIAGLEKALSASAIEEAVGKLKNHRGKVALPKFKVSAAARLRDDLIALGMPIAFSGDADFSGMVGRRELRIRNVVHQAYLKVDELGSEAAAATAVELFSDAFPAFSFTANRPFLFLIRDRHTGSILFLGRVVHPGRVS